MAKSYSTDEGAGETAGSAQGSDEDSSAIGRELNTHIVVMYGYSIMGYIAGIWIARVTYTITGTYRWSFGSQGLWIVPMVIVIWTKMPETVPPSRRKPATWEMVKQSILSILETVKLLCGARRIVLIMVVICSIAAVFSGVFNVILYWGEWKFGWGTKQVAIALTVGLLTQIFGTVACNRLAQWIGLENALVVLFVIATGASLGLGFATTNAWLWICLGLMGVGLGIAALNTILALEAPAVDQGRVQGASYSVQNVFWIVGIYVYWWMFEIYVDDDGYSTSGGHHRYDFNASLYLFVTAAVTAMTAALLFFAVGSKKDPQFQQRSDSSSGGGGGGAATFADQEGAA